MSSLWNPLARGGVPPGHQPTATTDPAGTVPWNPVARGAGTGDRPVDPNHAGSAMPALDPSAGVMTRQADPFHSLLPGRFPSAGNPSLGGGTFGGVGGGPWFGQQQQQPVFGGDKTSGPAGDKTAGNTNPAPASGQPWNTNGTPGGLPLSYDTQSTFNNNVGMGWSGGYQMPNGQNTPWPTQAVGGVAPPNFYSPYNGGSAGSPFANNYMYNLDLNGAYNTANWDNYRAWQDWMTGYNNAQMNGQAAPAAPQWEQVDLSKFNNWYDNFNTFWGGGGQGQAPAQDYFSNPSPVSQMANGGGSPFNNFAYGGAYAPTQSGANGSQVYPSAPNPAVTAGGGTPAAAGGGAPLAGGGGAGTPGGGTQGGGIQSGGSPGTTGQALLQLISLLTGSGGGFNSFGNPGAGNPFAYMTGDTSGGLLSVLSALVGGGSMSGMSQYSYPMLTAFGNYGGYDPNRNLYGTFY